MEPFEKPKKKSTLRRLWAPAVASLATLALFSGFWHLQSQHLEKMDLSSLGGRTAPNQQPVDPRVASCIAQSKLGLSGLPQPSQVKDQDFQPQLYGFLRNFKYRQLGWTHDKRVRDTGNFAKKAFNGADYNGTHPAVSIYYSPEVYCWLLTGRNGAIPDGAMIVKEMYPPPAARYQGNDLSKMVTPWWTTMVKDSHGSYDGWYWSELFDTVTATGERTDLQTFDHDRPQIYPDSNFGSYCVRCHASAERELTFASLNNIEEDFNFVTGKREKFGSPLEFVTEPSWKTGQAEYTKEYYAHSPHMMPRFRDPNRKFASNDPVDDPKQNPGFLKVFGDLFPGTAKQNIEIFTPDALDRKVQSPNGHQYLTSDQCMSCHGGDNSPFGPNMYLSGKGYQAKGIDLSPWGEWRWSMMGLAGRDPIFFAQLETEMTRFKNATGPLKPAVIADTCLRCHGAMGQRQFHLDLTSGKYHATHPEAAQGLFPLSEVSSKSKYGALARDGISCTVCHQMADNSHTPLQDIYTGQFSVVPPQNGLNQIFGPYKDPKVKPMEASLGVSPKYNPFMESSRMCASCHTIHLPAADITGTEKTSGFEQSTYLEWVNSAYSDHGATPKTCQACHMPDQYQGLTDAAPLKLDFKIANIQDQDFPVGQSDGERKEAHNMLALDDVTIPKRSPFHRHTLYGINLFALEFFNQFSDLLGRTKGNYMSELETGLETAIENGNQFAHNEAAKVEIFGQQSTGSQVSFKVRVTNLTGHRFPSGVGFRRAFLAVSLSDDQKLLWRSGGTNSVGVIVDGQGKVLDTEFFTNGKYQPHHQLITSDKQVQIYQELVQDDKNQFTTSFLSIFHHVKDNRLLPKGWSEHPTGDATIDPAFFEATRPVGEAASDPDYTSGRGDDVVDYQITLPAQHKGAVKITAQLFYQSIPPSYLKQRFESANGPATQRLFYLTSHLQTDETPIKNWKLPIAGDVKDLSP
jgi:mono/diheme cytochrome c family protein